jgi:hypothetical protein
MEKLKFSSNDSETKLSRLNSKSVNIIVLTVVWFLLSVSNSLAQQAYQGPAFGSIAGGVQVSTTQFQDLPEGSYNQSSSIYNWVRQRYDFPLIDDKFDRVSPLAPMNSNEFYDPAVLMIPLQGPHAPHIIIDFEGSRDPGNYIPPDPHLAVGPNHVITVDNSRFIIFDKKGNRIQSISAAGWYSDFGAGLGPFDCQIVYDHFAGRWVQEWMVVDEDNQTSFWFLSVSDDSDPIGTWINFAFPNHLNGTENVGNWGDYPKIGYDQQAFYISGRQFPFPVDWIIVK